MSPAVLVRLAQRSLLQHKLRSTLSVVGIVFGVAAVTAISSVAAGAAQVWAIAKSSVRAVPGVPKSVPNWKRAFRRMPSSPTRERSQVAGKPVHG